MSFLQYLVVIFITLTAVVATDDEPSIKLADFGSEVLTEEDFHSERVAGGVVTAIERLPFQVSIRVGNLTVCGGFILSTTWVMTAAHCVSGATPSLIVIRAGSSNLSSGGVTFQVLSYVVHSSYNISNGNDYDFALVNINGTFTFGTTIKAISIPFQNKVVPYLKNVIIAGWGITSQTGTVSEQLNAVSIKIIPQNICRLLYAGTASITDRMFCAGKLVFGGRGSCQGDVGGAALYKNMAIGVSSFGVTCGSPIFPSVFANVASVSIWVKGVTGI